MKIVCDKSLLTSGIGISLRAIPSKSTMQILSFIAIVAEDNKVRLVSNNLELGIETELDANVIEGGKICVEARMFSEIVKKLPNNEITMEVNDDTNSDSGIKNRTMLIKSGKVKFEIAVMSTDEFVFLPNFSGDENIEISHYDLKNIINQTEFSISDNENTKVMTGELFEIKGNNLRMVALDGNRIAIRNHNLVKEYKDVRAIIPGKTLRELSKIISDDIEKRVIIYFSDNHVTFKFDNTTVLSRLIDGNYYNVDKMLTDTHNLKVTVNKAEMLETVDRSLLLRRESDKKPIIFDIYDDHINFSMKTSVGSMNEDIDVTKTGDDLKIGFNPKFMIDALKNIDSEEIDFYFINPKSPCFIRDESKSYIYLILPINF
ncbi:MAG: DNA polymerase III subunit beta [Lachnospiraceae bacterium]|nr:DNA polymerase III subunit beta [Lachnospiraceae bacterium]